VQTLTCVGSAPYVIARYSALDYPALVSEDKDATGGGIGGNIKRARLAAGITTQTELAKRLGVPQPQLSDWENGRYGTPDVTTLLKIAATIPCTLDALVKGVDASYDRGADTRGGFSYEKKDEPPGGKTVQFETVSSQVSHIEQVASGAGGPRHVARDRLSKSQKADVAMLLRETEAVDKIIEHARAIGRLADPLTLFSVESAAALEHATRNTPSHEEVRRTRASGKKRKAVRR